MKQKKLVLILLSLLLLTSCNHPQLRQDDWHINTIELADEYFPKYFDAIEQILQKNSIQYEKEYFEQVNGQKKQNQCKHYIAKYNISDTTYFKAELEFDYWINNGSCISFSFINDAITEEEVFNISQTYIDVMIYVTNFCSYNFLGKGDGFNSLYEKLKVKYCEEKYSINNPPQYKIYATEKTWEETPPFRGYGLDNNDGLYNMDIFLIDYLTDINIWDK
ncbi:MAG: hypothetical protein J1F32_05855 [Erysipelotrichales bacterium]|nr:hypothetical protein [Erysipelotrichales bacterium]